jgi:hypothetical protein
MNLQLCYIDLGQFFFESLNLQDSKVDSVLLLVLKFRLPKSDSPSFGVILFHFFITTMLTSLSKVVPLT